MSEVWKNKQINRQKQLRALVESPKRSQQCFVLEIVKKLVFPSYAKRLLLVQLMCVTSPELSGEVKICNIRTWTSKRKVYVEYPYLSGIKEFLPRLSFDQYRVWKRGSGVLRPHPELLSSHPESRIQVFFRTTCRAKTSARLATQAIVKSCIPSRNFVFSQDPRFYCVKSRTENTLLDHVDME